jgi:hypothetical protein
LGLARVQGAQPGEIGEAPIHNVKAASFWDEDVKHVDLVHLAIRDMNKGRNIPPEVKQSMEFDGGLGSTEPGPREYREAQVYRGDVKRVGGLGEFHRKAVVGVELPCSPDQVHAEVGVDAPIALFVDVCQGGTGYPATDAQVVKLGLMGAQASLNVAQALTVGQLCESHAQELVEM